MARGFMRAKGHVHWIFPIVPIFASLVWLSTLLGLLLSWIHDGRPKYASMNEGQTIAYISDVGAQRLKPLFIAGSAITVVLFDLVFISERILRHRGTLAVKSTHKSEQVLSGLAALFSIVGAAGLIFLSIFDTLRHPKTHDKLLIVFIIGYLLTAIFVCAEYHRLKKHQTEFRIIRYSYWLKVAWVIIFLALAIAFGVEQKRKKPNTAARLEWAIGFIFAIFVASFFIDFLYFEGSEDRGADLARQQSNDDARHPEMAHAMRNPQYNNNNVVHV